MSRKSTYAVVVFRSSRVVRVRTGLARHEAQAYVAAYKACGAGRAVAHRVTA